MGVHIEAFILYIVIFFSQTVIFFITGREFETASFSINSLLLTILIYFIPSIIMILFLLYRKKKPEYRLVKPKINDLFSGLITLPALFLIGIIISFFSLLFGTVFREPLIPSPSTPSGWVTLCIYCLFAAYLEEIYFRFYLLSKKEELRLTAPFALIISSLLFGICHLYGGFWGFLNAFLAGLLLGGIFLRYRAIHGIAIAHAAYNITAFILARGL